MSKRKITNNQAKAIVKLFSDDSHSAHHLRIELTKNIIPHLFEKKQIVLEVGEWYKCIEKGFESLIVITDLEGNKAYGFSYYGENDRNIWNNESNCGWLFKLDTKNWELATEQEVFEALTKEAVKRGFKEGVAVKYPWFSELNKQHYIYTPDFKKESILENERFLYLGCCVFCGGQWAEIIPTITKEEAEKQLGKKIV